MPRRGSRAVGATAPNGRIRRRAGGPAHAPSSAGREGERADTRGAGRAVRRDPRPEAIEEIRAAADELRAELAGDVATFVVNRNINFTNVCTVGCAFCGFGQTRALSRCL